MYVCQECGELFTQPKLDVEIEAHWEIAEFGNVPTEEIRTWECPKCGSTDFRLAGECIICGQPHGNYAGLCDDCLDNLRSDFEKIRQGMGITVDDFELAVQDSFGW